MPLDLSTLQPPLPPFYKEQDPESLAQHIRKVKASLGPSLVVLTHHYQRPEVVALGDVRGDSLKLAQYAASLDQARFVLYCGVHFMAESADILKRGEQTVVLPDMGAGCDMADMADDEDVAEAWDEELVPLLGSEQGVFPITYINSTAALKAFVGRKGGVVCTSSNARGILQSVIEAGKKVFFFPDQHLGRNTAKALGIPLDRMALWDPTQPLGGNTPGALAQAQVFLWKGHCPVHAMFSVKQIQNLLARDPGFRIISHPECPMEVVDMSHEVGSTEFIVKTIAQSPPGSKWAVGTEMNLVNRIALENPTKTVVSINPYMCLCGTMNRIDLAHMAWALDQIYGGTWEGLPNVITVGEPHRSWAKVALDRMLDQSQ